MALENYFDIKRIKWDEILRQIKKREKDGLQYDRHKRIYGKRGVVSGLKKIPCVGSDNDTDDE